MRAVYLPVKPNDGEHSIEAGPFTSRLVGVPSCSDDQLIVKVKACNLQLWDKLQVLYMIKKDLNELSMGHGFSGIVSSVGAECRMWQPGDEVMGIVPLDYNRSACAEYVCVSQYDLVGKPRLVSHAHAASCLEDLLKAYTGLVYLGRLRPDDTVFIPRGSTGSGSMFVQLANSYGARVITTAHSADELSYLESLQLENLVIVDSREVDGREQLLERIMQETLQLGVDIVVDQANIKQQVGDSAAENTVDTPSSFLSADDLSLLLAVGGRFVTQQLDLQVGVDLSRKLMLRCCSVSFLFVQSWLLSGSQLGRYQHVLLDAADKLQQQLIRPNVHHTVPFHEVTGALERLTSIQIGNTVAVMD